ncbi:hypothetical protein HNQ92_000034 [Rhabdobacter roseus]|uniref:Uncharacterized protein n=1 Tax=Rhabdobacter roseus TaxID=1655419 RepID=A0A840TL26_9BACT|nr:hypothetical protein [Rhabdobacter roseus]
MSFPMPAGLPALWQIIEQLLNDKLKRKYNLRKMVDCILKIFRIGIQCGPLRGRNLKRPSFDGKSSTASVSGASTARWNV